MSYRSELDTEFEELFEIVNFAIEIGTDIIGLEGATLFDLRNATESVNETWQEFKNNGLEVILRVLKEGSLAKCTYAEELLARYEEIWKAGKLSLKKAARAKGLPVWYEIP